jgi:hypothetical protein
LSSDEQPEIPREVQDAIEPAAANFVALRDDLIEGANYYIRATGAIDAPDRREVVA